MILKQVIKSGVNISCCYFVCSLRSTIWKRMGKLACYNTQPHLKGITAMFCMSEWVSGWKLILKVNSSQSDTLKEKHLFPEVYYGMDNSLILWHLFLDLGFGVFELTKHVLMEGPWKRPRYGKLYWISWRDSYVHFIRLVHSRKKMCVNDLNDFTSKPSTPPCPVSWKNIIQMVKKRFKNLSTPGLLCSAKQTYSKSGVYSLLSNYSIGYCPFWGKAWLSF